MRARQTAIVLVVVAALACALDAATASAARRSCATLKGKRLKGSGSVRVVVQEKQVEGISEQVAYVCPSPKGPAWLLNTDFRREEEAQVSLKAAAGNWVAFTIVSAVGIAYEETGEAINARTGKSFRYWSFAGGPGPDEPSEVLEAVQINARGQLACAVGAAVTLQEGLATRKIFGVEPSGKRQALDSAPLANIPPSSLKLSGSTVQWTDAGVARSASL
jgi:hypothetical protein